MELPVSNPVTELLAMEGGSRVDFHERLHKVIASGSLDFDNWTSLISEIEKTYQDNIEIICLVYDSFLSNFPLCRGYWSSYADHKTRLCTVDKAVEIFERAVQAATYSVGVWVDYFSFSMYAFEDPHDVRRLFKRGMSFVGKDYLCHTLWDKYIEFEFSQQQWSFLVRIYIQILKFPTKKLHRYYDNFKKFVAMLKEEMERQNDCSNEEQSEAVPCSEVTITDDEISHVIKDLLDSSVGSVRSKALQKYISIAEQFYQEASRLEGKILCFETHIRRPYFHVKPLDDKQLENWHHYLDFVEKQEDFDWAVKLYERCLISCANYPEFWMRYVDFMETKGGRELANFALDRATKIFLKNLPAIHLFNARFKEHIGDVLGAHASYLQSETGSNSHFIENVIKEANMEKRLGNFAAAFHVYEKALETAAERQKLHTVPNLYIHFSRLKYMITNSVDAAIDVIVDGIQHVPRCKLLVEGLINLAMMHGGQKQLNVVDSIIANAISPGPDLAQGLSTKDLEDISLLYLEFVDYCGTIHDVRKAWNRHIKLFPHLIRTTTSFKDSATGNQLLNMTMDGRQSNSFGISDQPSGDYISSHLNQLGVQEQQPSLPENHVIQSDQVLSDQFQREDDDNRAQGRLPQLPPSVEQSIEDACGVIHLTHDLVHRFGDDASVKSTHLVHQSGEEVIAPMESTHASVKSTHYLVHQSGEEAIAPMESTHDLVHQSKDASGTTESTHDLVNQVADDVASLEASQKFSDVQQEQDHELEQQLKPLSLGGISLNLQDKESQDLIPMASCECDTPQETSVSNGIPESCQNANGNPSIASRRSSSPADSMQIQNESVNPSSSASHQNPRLAHEHPEQQVPPNSGRKWHQMNNTVNASKDASSGFHGHLQGQPHQQQQISPQQQSQPVEMDAQNLLSKCYPHDPLSWHNSPVGQGVQAQNQYQAGAAQENLIATGAWPIQIAQQQNSVSVSESHLSPQPVSHPQAQMSPCPMQSREQLGHAQHSQAYNQMSQYCYQQQQHYLQQQQNQQQQLLLLQQQQYLQQQQQLQPPPQPHQTQQLQQQQHLIYLQQPLEQQQQQYQQLQQLQPQTGQQLWQQQYHQFQQWQQLQEGYQQLQQQHLLQQQQDYQQRLQQAELRPQEEYQKLQQLALQPQEGYQQLLQQYQLQQQQDYQQRLQQGRLQPQEEYQKLQQQEQLQHQPGYQQQQQQQQHQQPQQQNEEQLQHPQPQPQPQRQVASTQILTWNGSYYQQGQAVVPPHSMGVSELADSPYPQRQSPQGVTPQQSAGTSGFSISPHHQKQSPQGATPPLGAGTSGPSASPHHRKQSPHGVTLLHSSGDSGPAVSSSHPEQQSPLSQ
ncbi:hypothetical protein F0562_018222 [Nyssa sinensis]|uniref:Suppressor of forked domain-containing protein n=1 Tax=Nyssa sinensis TaxID=561372 RepID=A0A5J4Z998_9ASTE|nr:hypothetical protein F0562_018222 [Nyssa sinensis]